jgi:hypothetical protein
LLGPNGEVKNTWVKTSVDRDAQLQILREAMKDLVEPYRGKVRAVPAPKIAEKDLLAVYPLADPHIGMLSWAKETGEDFDLQIAEGTLKNTVDRLVASAPPAERALLINLGDFFHSDGGGNTTTKGTPVDVDSRFAKIALAGMRIKRQIIDRLLRKHKHVEVWTKAGNHDENTAIMLAVALSAVYEKEPRVEISMDPARFQVKEFGVNLIGGAHGHTSTLARLPGFLASNWPEEWGRTEHRIWYTGHVHHDSAQEHLGCMVETLRTVAVRDAWHVGQAYHSGRDLKCDVWHKKNGRIARIIQRAIKP